VRKRCLLRLLIAFGFSMLWLGEATPHGQWARLAHLFGAASAQAGPAGTADRDWIDVRTVGARGDGKADDTTAIQKALDAGSRVYLPPGTYVTSKPLEVASNQVLAGAGNELTIIQNTVTDGIRKKTALPSADSVTMQDFKIIAGIKSGTSTQKAFDLTAFIRSRFINLRAKFAKWGFYLARGPAGEACWFNSFTDLQCFACQTGVILSPTRYSVNSNTFSNLVVQDVGVWKATGVGVDLAGYGNRFYSIYTGGMRAAGVRIRKVAGNNVIVGLYVESSPKYAVDLGAGTGGRRNILIGLHKDGPTSLNDPHGELTIIDSEHALERSR